MIPVKTAGQIQGYSTRILILLLDLLSAAFSFGVAIVLTHRLNFAPVEMMLGAGGVILIVLRALSFKLFGSYSLIIRYIGEQDYRKAFYAVTTSSILFFIIVKVFPEILPTRVVTAVVFVDYFLLLILTVGGRFLAKSLSDRLRWGIGKTAPSRLNTVIFGAGELGAMVARVLQHNHNHNYHVSAFFDDKPMVHGKFLNGIKIFDPRTSFDRVVKKYDIKVAIIGIQELPDDRRIEFINDCLKHKVKVLKIPTTESWLNANLGGIGQLENIKFEDLLNRDPIRLDLQAINDTVNDKVVMVTGCAGSIGSEIVRQLLKFHPGLVVGVDQAETPMANLNLELRRNKQEDSFKGIIGDVRDKNCLFRIFEEYRPEYVFHAAAYKHVPIMEDYPAEAVKVNVLGTRNLADLAVEFGVKKFVMVSTDKVVNPANVMGASKRIAEIYVQAINFKPDNETQFITTRFGNVLGSNGSVVPIFKEQIQRKEPVTVTHPDITRYFMTIPEACQLVLEAGVMGKGGEIFVFDMGKPVRILDLAQKMIQLSGLTPGKDIEIKFTGLRPGEKLYEELLDQKEGNIPTHHEKIMKATVRPSQYGLVLEQIDQLGEGVQSGIPSHALVGLMKEIVPEFASKNSVFSTLDK